MANRSRRVRAVLDAFAPGFGRDLFILRGDPGIHRGSGAKRAAVTMIHFREATPEELRTAHNAAGGGERGTAAAQALLDRGVELRKAEIVLGGRATATDKLHELGHVEQGLLDPERAIEESAEAEAAPTIEDYEKSESEQYADEFEEEVRKDVPSKE